MDAIMASFKFTDPKIQQAARTFVENYRRQTTDARALGHSVETGQRYVSTAVEHQMLVDLVGDD